MPRAHQPQASEFAHKKESACRWSRLHSKANAAGDRFFYHLGYWVASRPKTTLSTSLLCVVLCCFGFTNFSVESDSADLWVPAESLSKKQEETVRSYFDEASEFALVVLEHPEEGGNVLTKDSLDVFWELDAKILKIETAKGNTFGDLCISEVGEVTCAQPVRGISRFWGNSFDTYKASVRSDADVLAAVNVPHFPDGQAVTLPAIFGSSATYDENARITSARAFVQGYQLETSLGDEEEYEESLEWERLFQDLLEAEADAMETLKAVYYTGRSLDDALADSVSGELFLFVATYIVMVLFVMACLGRCQSDSVDRRSWLGPAGIGVVLASGLAAYGVNSACGVPFTALSQILPFILIGIGVDDMFVLVASFDHTDATLPVEKRMALALKRCGMSITYTSLTNFAAFMLGSFTSLPAVRYFCFYAGTAILFDFILQMTAFSALLAMDSNRQQAGRNDWCCCCINNDHLEDRAARRGVTLPGETNESQIELGNSQLGDGRRNNSKEVGILTHKNPLAELSERAASLASKTSGSIGFDGEEDHVVCHITGVGKFLKDTYAPWLLSAIGKTLVLLASASLLAAGVYGTMKVTNGFDALDIAPDDHFARDYMELVREYSLDHTAQYVSLGVYTPAVDYQNTTVQAFIQINDALMTNERHFSGPVDSWLASFLTWAETSPEYSENMKRMYGYQVYDDTSTFYEALRAFMAAGNNARFLSDVAFGDDGKIEMSKSNMVMVGLTSTASYVEAIKDARVVMSRSPLQPQPFGFSNLFVFIEQFLVIYDELISNFLLALAGVAALSLLVLGRFRIVALVCFTVVIIDIELLGFVYHWGLQVNGITVIELIMAVGLVVDYMVHIVHYYLHQDRSIAKDLRIGHALGEIGPSVMLGAATTFVGIMPMAFAHNVVFRVFFKMFLVIITFGFFHGFVFIPVALSLIPESHSAPPLKDAREGRPKATEETTVEAANGTSTDDWAFFTGEKEKVVFCSRCSTAITERGLSDSARDGSHQSNGNRHPHGSNNVGACVATAAGVHGDGGAAVAKEPTAGGDSPRESESSINRDKFSYIDGTTFSSRGTEETKADSIICVFGGGDDDDDNDKEQPILEEEGGPVDRLGRPRERESSMDCDRSRVFSGVTFGSRGVEEAKAKRGSIYDDDNDDDDDDDDDDDETQEDELEGGDGFDGPRKSESSIDHDRSSCFSGATFSSRGIDEAKAGSISTYDYDDYEDDHDNSHQGAERADRLSVSEESESTIDRDGSSFDSCASFSSRGGGYAKTIVSTSVYDGDDTIQEEEEEEEESEPVDSSSLATHRESESTIRGSGCSFDGDIFSNFSGTSLSSRGTERTNAGTVGDEDDEDDDDYDDYDYDDYDYDEDAYSTRETRKRSAVAAAAAAVANPVEAATASAHYQLANDRRRLGRRFRSKKKKKCERGTAPQSLSRSCSINSQSTSNSLYMTAPGPAPLARATSVPLSPRNRSTLAKPGPEMEVLGRPWLAHREVRQSLGVGQALGRRQASSGTIEAGESSRTRPREGQGVATGLKRWTRK